MIRNGVIWEGYDIGGGDGQITDFDSTLVLTPEEGKDSWFVFMVQSDERASVVYPGKRVFAFSNPLFIDADGDEVFTSGDYRSMEEGRLTFCP